MRIAVAGAGVVGTILAGHLARGGRKPTLVDASAERLESLRRFGLRIRDPRGCLSGDFDAPAPELRRSLTELAARPPELLFLCMKACALEDSLPEIQAATGPRTRVVSFQNGLGTEDIIAGALGREVPVLRVVINYAGSILDGGAVGVGFFNRPNWIGARAQEHAGAARETARLLSESGLATEYTERIADQVWEKVILNAALCPASALTHLTIGEVMRIPPLRPVVEGILREGIAVAEGEGVRFDAGFFAHCMDYLDKAGPHRPSMCADCEAGRRTEIDFLNGMIAARGARAGIPVPYNETVTALIKGLEKHMREKEAV